jgi:DNA-binding transcriptional LysR family regulator
LLHFDDRSTITLPHDAHAWSGGANDAEWKVWVQEAGALRGAAGQGRFFSLADMAIQAALNDQGIATGRTALVGDLLEAGVLVVPFALKVKRPASYWLAFLGAHSETAPSRIAGPAQSLRYALAGFGLTGIWAAWHFYAAVGSLKSDLAKAGSA